MTIHKLKNAALKIFGEHGYNGSSLAQIAEEVGIKKQSIYTYFKSKDALYMTLSKEAMETELHFMTDYLTKARNESMEQALAQLLLATQQRFTQQLGTKFFITSTFITPPHLEKNLTQQIYFYLDTLETLFIAYFNAQQITVTAQDAANSFLALLDSLYVEMLYGGEARFEKRLQASWNVYYRGITN